MASASSAALARQSGSELLPGLARFHQPRKGVEHSIQKPAQPDALAASFDADPVQPVVPIAGSNQRNPMSAELRGSFERTPAMVP